MERAGGKRESERGRGIGKEAAVDKEQRRPKGQEKGIKGVMDRERNLPKRGGKRRVTIALVTMSPFHKVLDQDGRQGKRGSRERESEGKS